jgi:RNA polymerase sigma factor (sigma-70 family)
MAGGRQAREGLTPQADAAVRRSLIEGRHIIIAFLTRRVGADDAEEVFQRFAVRALESTDNLRDIRSLRTWLSRILMSTLVDHLRQRGRRHRREQLASESELESVGGVSDPEATETVCACLYKVLPTLRPVYAEVVWRVDLLGEPRERTAASLGTTLGNVNVRLHRGRLALRRRLEEMCLTCPVHGFLDCQCDEAERVRGLHETERSGRQARSAAASAARKRAASA